MDQVNALGDLGRFPQRVILVNRPSVALAQLGIVVDIRSSEPRVVGD